MSAGTHAFSRAPRDPELLGELLHSLSQPLTSLRCSLELSVDEATEQQQQTVSVALEQTETVMGMIQLMREYLDAEQSAEQRSEQRSGQRSAEQAVALMPVVKSMGEDLSSIAALANIRMRVLGTCAAKIRVAEPRLRLALQYLILAMIEQQPAGSEITLLLAEGPAGAVLRAQGGSAFAGREPSRHGKSEDNPQPKRDLVRATMRRVRMAIADRVLENGGATLVMDHGSGGFVLRIPRPTGAV